MTRLLAAVLGAALAVPGGVVGAEAAAAKPRRAPASLRTRLDRAIARAQQREGLKHALWAVDVRSLKTGRPLYSRLAETSLMPASSLKLATTAAALDAFGPDARFSTTVEAVAPASAFGRVVGDLYLIGSGDPTLSRELAARPEHGAFEILAETLRAAGIRGIDGRVVGYEGPFVGERRGTDWTWEDLVWWYGAEVSALTFADGSAHLKMIPGALPGEPLVIERHPASAYFKVESKAGTCAAADVPGLTLVRPFGGNVIQLAGCLPPASAPVERWIALEDPVLYAATVFAEALAAKGITVAGGVGRTATLPETRHTLAAYAGAPMSEALKDVNKPSHNLRAEMLLRALGLKVSGEGSAQAGRQAVVAFLEAQKIDTAGWDVLDGSGLSRSDLVTARGLTDLLVAMDRHPHAAIFRDSLPVAGIDGTLKRRLGGTRTRDRILAKTGTLRHTSALAGYTRPARGEGAAFAIVVNHATSAAGEIQEAVDDVAEALLGS